MKRSVLSLVAIAALLLTSCFKSDYDDGGYSNIYPGYVIYSNARTTNNLALDGVSMAIRFAILNAEMVSDGDLSFVEGSTTELNWNLLPDFRYDYNSIDYNPKEFLFGADASILNPEANKYTITFGDSDDYHTRALYDGYYRKGGFIIDTQGKSIIETDEGSKWEVTINDLVGLGYADDSEESDSVVIMESSSCTASIYYAGGGVFNYETTIEVEVVSTSDTAYWSSRGSVTLANFTDLLITSTKGNNCSFNIETSSGYSIGGVKIPSYQTTSPLIHNIETLPYTPVGGIETATISGVDSSDYPSSSVEVQTYSSGSRIFRYNGYTYTN